jgi:MFS family permease
MKPTRSYSAPYQRMVLALLTAAYTFNAMDRSIISIIGQSMKLDLRLSDTELGLLGGPAFAVLYAFGGIPAARLAERFSRVNIIAAALALWSALSALCGAAAGFSQLLLMRAGVGVAEAGCSPPAHSLISDYFETRRRTSALSIYSCGISLGYLIIAVGGGYVAQHWGWRAACVSVGLPGILLALLIKISIDEPQRSGVPLPALSLASEMRELGAVARALLSRGPVLHMVLGVTISAFAAYGFYLFMPAYFLRTFHLNYARVGIIAGLAGGVAVGLGIIAGGFGADALARRSPRWYALVPATGGIISVPLYALAIAQPEWRTATVLLSIAGFFQYTGLGPTFGVVQNAVKRQRRATATAVLFICLNVFALGGGPLFTGWVIDRFADVNFRHATAASFASVCLGDAAPAPAAGNAQCAATLARSTRQGLEVTLLFFGWATVHYFLASAGLGKVLKEAASSVQSDST